MIYLKENPIGIDNEIQKIQEYLYVKLSEWNLEGFGRVYVNEELLPIWFYKKEDYKNVLNFKNGTNGSFFFTESGDTEVKKSVSSTDIDLIFLLNLPKIKTLINHRADEEVKVDIEKILQAHQTRIELKITKGDKALSGFKTNLKDRQPYHFIKFTFKIYYNNY